MNIYILAQWAMLQSGDGACRRAVSRYNRRQGESIINYIYICGTYKSVFIYIKKYEYFNKIY